MGTAFTVAMNFKRDMLFPCSFCALSLLLLLSSRAMILNNDKETVSGAYFLGWVLGNVKGVFLGGNIYRGLEAVGTWLSGEITLVNNTKKRGGISWGGESRHLKASSQSLPTMRLIPKRLILNSECKKKHHRNSFLFLFHMRGRVKDTSSDEQKDDLTNGSTSSDEQKDDLTNGSKEGATYIGSSA